MTQLSTISKPNILRRNNRGCKSEDFYKWPEQPFDEMDSPLAVQQYIQQVIRRDPSDIDEILKLPDGQDLGAWKIEHLRLFCMQLNSLASKLQECCHPETCTQMTATEQWIFLCAAHKQPNECPAIDYTRHTLDGAASLLNSNKYFPSRVTIKESSVAKLGSVCRRIYRIFSHAYYHHFQVFDEFERETSLCKRFSKFVTNYELMSKDSLIVPSDGSQPAPEPTITAQQETTGGDVVPGSADSDSPTRSVHSENVPKQQDIPNTEEGTVSAAQSKPDAKDAEDPAGPSPGVEWSSSTSTMVKGSGITVNPSNNSKANPGESPTKPKDGDNVVPTSIPSNPANNAPVQNTSSPKRGKESEA